MPEPEPPTSSSHPDAPPPGAATFFTLFPAIMLPMFLALVDQTIVAAALPTIAGDLGNPERVSWIVIAYLIAATIASPVYGRLGDHLGRKRLLMIALGVVIGATILCGFAPTVEVLIVGRVLQGLGGGGLAALSQALISETIPPRQRARYQGFMASLAAFATAFGAVVGGILTQYFGWRSIFFVSVPLGLLAILLLRRLPTRAARPEPFRFDTLGLVLFIVFITSALLMLRDAQVFTLAILLPSLGLFALSALAFYLLVRREQRVAHPLFPIPLFRHPTIWRADTMALFHGAALISLLTFLPIHLRLTFGSDPGEIGLMLIPITTGIAVGSTMTGLLVSWTGRTAALPSVGLVVVIALFAAIAIWLPYFSAWQLSLTLGLTAFFMGTVMAVVQVTVQTAAGAGFLGTAAASVQLSRTVGAALGTAIVGVVVFATIAVGDPEAATLLADVLKFGPEALSTLPPERAAMVAAEIGNAFRGAYLTIALFCLIVMVLAWTLPLRRI